MANSNKQNMKPNYLQIIPKQYSRIMKLAKQYFVLKTKHKIKKAKLSKQL